MVKLYECSHKREHCNLNQKQLQNKTQKIVTLNINAVTTKQLLNSKIREVEEKMLYQ